MKRIVDLVFCCIAMLLLSIPFVFVFLAVWVKLGSPVIFRQSRPGLKGHTFEMLKFRTMNDQRSADGSLLHDSERLTNFGKLLRSTSVDEIPALWNVFKGHMSFVGPRPLLVEYLDLYSEEQARRHDVRPGITGWAQINGRNALSWEEKFAMDVWYVDNQSMILDFKILFKTVMKVLKRDGISQQGQATMQKFKSTKS